MRRALAWVFGWIVLVIVPASARGDIYSFVDPDGTVHFTNVPGGDRRFKLYMRSHEGTRSRVGPPASRPTDRSAERFSRYDDFIREAAALYQIPMELVRAVIKVESDYDPRAVSRAGAQGLMQLMPGTAERMQVRDILDPRENVLGGVRYLRVLANMFNGDLELTIAAYNAGENAVLRYGGIPPYGETTAYVTRVLSSYRRYRAVHDPVAASVAGEE